MKKKASAPPLSPPRRRSDLSKEAIQDAFHQPIPPGAHPDGSILEPSKPNFFPVMMKIVGTLSPKSSFVEAISACLRASMSVARFDFSWGDGVYHQGTLENLKLTIKATKKLCTVMLHTVGMELQVVDKSGLTISLEENESVVLTRHQGQEASSKLLPINFSGLAEDMKPGDTIFVGQTTPL